MAKLNLPCLAALALLTPLARAQTENQAAAEVLFDEARRLTRAGDYAAACPKFAESQRLDAGIGTLLHLADCYEKIGKTASAWAAFREAFSMAKQAGRLDRARVAEEHAVSLENRLSRLVLRFPAAPGLVVKRDGVVVGVASSGVPFPVDPGEHDVSAEAPGRKRWSTRVEVKGPGELSISVPELEADAAPVPTAAPAPTAPAATSASASAPAASAPAAPAAPPAAALTGPRGSSGAVTAGWVGVGLGAVSLGVGAVLGAKAWSAYGERRSYCAGNLCDQKGVDLTEQARGQANLSTIFVGAGLALGGAGAALLLWGKPGQETALSPVATPSLVGLSVRGSL